MFQTEPILWLQSLGSPPLTWLLSGVTLLGYPTAYVVLVLVLLFALRLRPGLAVLGGLLLCGLLTEGIKSLVAYPRPDEVDRRVTGTSETKPLKLGASGGATSFWGPPRTEAVEAVRRRAAGDYGFPSGHVSAATACLLCAAFFFRSRRVLLFAAVWVPLMTLSRMYLGRHFLADVLGGLAVGVLATGLALALFWRLDDSAFARRGAPAAAWLPLALLSLALLALTPFEPLLQPLYVGGLAGLAASYGLLLRTGLPRDDAPRRRRAARAGLGGVVLLAALGGCLGLREAGVPGGRLAALGVGLVVPTLTLVGTVALCRRLGLYDESGVPSS